MSVRDPLALTLTRVTDPAGQHLVHRNKLSTLIAILANTAMRKNALRFSLTAYRNVIVKLLPLKVLRRLLTPFRKNSLRAQDPPEPLCAGRADSHVLSKDDPRCLSESQSRLDLSGAAPAPAPEELPRKPSVRRSLGGSRDDLMETFINILSNYVVGAAQKLLEGVGRNVLTYPL